MEDKDQPTKKEKDMSEKKDDKKKRDKKKEDHFEKREIDQEDLLGIDVLGTNPPSTASPDKGGFHDDLLNIGLNDEVYPTPSPKAPNAFRYDSPASAGLLGLGEFISPSPGQLVAQGKNPPIEVIPAHQVIVPRTQAGLSGRNGFEISGAVQRTQTGLVLHLAFKNFLQAPIVVSSLALVPNTLKLGCNYTPNSAVVPPQGAHEAFVQLVQTGIGIYTSMLSLQFGTNYDNFMAGVTVYPHVLSELSAPVTTDEFKAGWVVGTPFVLDQPLIPATLNSEESLKQLFRSNGINHLSSQAPLGIKKYYFGCRLQSHEVSLIEITVPSPNMLGGYQIVAKSTNPTLSKGFAHSIASILS